MSAPKHVAHLRSMIHQHCKLRNRWRKCTCSTQLAKIGRYQPNHCSILTPAYCWEQQICCSADLTLSPSTGSVTKASKGTERALRRLLGQDCTRARAIAWISPCPCCCMQLCKLCFMACRPTCICCSSLALVHCSLALNEAENGSLMLSC